MDLRKKYQDACEKQGWSLTNNGDGEIYVSKPVGYGEFGFEAYADDFAACVRDRHDNFDVDKYVEMELDGHPSSGDINIMLDEVAEARGNGERAYDLRVMLVEAGDDAKDIQDKLNEVAKACGDAKVIDEVEGLLDWLVEVRSEAEGIKDDLKELAETLEAKERERFDIKLGARVTPDDANIWPEGLSGALLLPEGAVLGLADGREVYADFLGCSMQRADIGSPSHNAEYLVGDVAFRDKKGSKEVLLGEDELRDAVLKAVHVRCTPDKEQMEGLYFETKSITIEAFDPDNDAWHDVMHDNSDRSLGHVDVHAADHSGNDWHIADHKVERKPGLDDIIKGAQDRAAAESSGKDRSVPEMEH